MERLASFLRQERVCRTNEVLFEIEQAVNLYSLGLDNSPFTSKLEMKGIMVKPPRPRQENRFIYLFIPSLRIIEAISASTSHVTFIAGESGHKAVVNIDGNIHWIQHDRWLLMNSFVSEDFSEDIFTEINNAPLGQVPLEEIDLRRIHLFQ